VSRMTGGRTKKERKSTMMRRLTEVRLRSEEIAHRGAHVLGVIRDGSSVKISHAIPVA
jgi:hypothetical protein